MARVLIVDDRPDQARLVSALLEAAEFVTETVDSGEAALEAIRDRTPDVIVTDLVMPGLSGLDVVESVKVSHPSLPVILMTAHGNGEIAARALQHGAASYVPKRLLHEILVDTVTDTYELSCSRREEARIRERLVGTKLEFELDNDPTLITPLVNFVQRHVTRHAGAVDENQLMQVGVAVHEALTNAIVHGNLGLGSESRETSWSANQKMIDERRSDERFGSRRVRLTAAVAGRELCCEIADEGDGFDPSLIPDPTDPENVLRASGRGLYLIGTFMDSVRFNEIGNRITMIKALGPAASAVADEANDDRAWADFDQATLAKTERMIGRRAVGEIVDLFLGHAPTEMEALAAAAGAGDGAAVARAAHSLRSSAFNVGALRLYDLAGTIERAAGAGDCSALDSDGEQLRATFDAACARLGEYRSRLRVRRIAVVEDNPDNRVLTRALLEGSYEVLEFESGPDAITALSAAPPDLILLDISLPGLDGIEVLRRLRTIDGLRDVPVVALTAHAMASDREQLLGEGFDEYVSKPIVDERDLLDPVERLLGTERD